MLDISLPTATWDSTKTRLTRSCLKHFEGLPRLKILQFSFPIEDSDLPLLMTLPRFAPESLVVNSVSDAGVFELTRLRSLKTLTIRKGSFLSLLPLRRLPNLRDLRIHGKGIDDQQLAGVVRLHQLERLSLGQTSASNWLVAKLVNLPNLKWLDVRNTKVSCDRRSFALTENQTAGFAALRNLEFLEIDGVTDASLVNICKAGNLNHIYLKFGTLTAKSLETLQSHPKLKKVRSTHSGLKHRQLDSIGF